MRKLGILIVTLLVLFSIYFYKKKRIHENKNTIHVTVIEPMEHKAMDSIVAGFSETLAQDKKYKFKMKTENAQNDPNLLRSLLEIEKNSNSDFVVPIATAPTLMAISTIHNKPILGLAANFTEDDRRKLKYCNVTVIHDEIPVDKLLTFYLKAYPKVKTLALIHSPTDKIMPDVKKALEFGKQYGVKITPFMITSLPEIVSTLHSLPESIDGVFILKDSLVVIGIATIAQYAQEKHVPLMTSDEGSVEDGAHFSLGVYEKQIGESGAQLLLDLIHSKKNICNAPLEEMKNLSVFINNNSIIKSKMNSENIIQAARELKYNVTLVK